MGSLAYQWRDEEWGRVSLTPLMASTVAFSGPNSQGGPGRPPRMPLRVPALGPASAVLGPIVTLFGHHLVANLLGRSTKITVEQPAPSCSCTCGADGPDRVAAADLSAYVVLFVFASGLVVGLFGGALGAGLLLRVLTPASELGRSSAPVKGTKAPHSRSPGPSTPSSWKGHGRGRLPNAGRRGTAGPHSLPGGRGGVLLPPPDPPASDRNPGDLGGSHP